MKRTSQATLLATLLTSSFALSCNDRKETTPSEGDSDLGEATQNVNGVWDTTNAFPGVAIIYTGSGMCSGSLVSTRYIVTAAHCFNATSVNQDVTVIFDPNATLPGYSVPSSRVFRRTAGISPIWIHPEFPLAAPIDWHDGVFSRDVAVFALDTVVPTSIATRYQRVAGVAGNPVCRFDGDAPMSERSGQNVGFGGFTEADNDQYRSYATTWGWQDVTSPECGDEDWEDGCNAYIMNELERETLGWASPGDSGGPLFEGIYNEGDQNLICGNSSYRKWWTFAVDEAIYSNYSRGTTNQFLNAVLTDPKNGGWLRGACDTVMGDPSTDPDGDGINNAVGCDVCPNIADPTQLDSDNDGVGDRCDNCPTVRNSDQRNDNVIGQRIQDGPIVTLDRTRPNRPTNILDVAAWQQAFPGNACNPHPVTALEGTTGATSDNTNTTRPYYPTWVDNICTSGSSGHSPGEAKPEANNVIVIESFVGGENAVAANTRMAFCRCAEIDDDIQCMASCGRGSNVAEVPVPMGVSPWQPMRLQESGPGKLPLALNPGGLYTAMPSTQTLGDIVTFHPSARPSGTGAVTTRPEVRQLAWKYWDDFDPSELLALPTQLPNPATFQGTSKVVSKPLLWSWTRNFAAPGTPRSGTTDTHNAKRRQDLMRMTLTERTGRQVDMCDALKRLVLPERVGYLPNSSGCHKCGTVARFRRPQDVIYPGLQYVAPHAGVRPLADVAAPELLDLLADDNLEVVVASDKASGVASGADRAAVYTKDTHDLVAALYHDEGTLKVRYMNHHDDLMPGAGDGVAFSAARNEVAFFDGYNTLNFDQLAMRRISLDLEYTFTYPLMMVDAPLAGPVVSAAYRDLDDAYFILSRGGGKIALHRVDLTMATRLVAEWADSGVAKHVDVTISDEGVVALTRRDADAYGVFVITVAPDLTVGHVSYIVGSEPLLLPAVITPEGLALERAGVAVDEIISLDQSNAPVTYMDASASLLEEMFQ